MQCKNIADETDKLLMTFSGRLSKTCLLVSFLAKVVSTKLCIAPLSATKKAKLHVIPENGQVACAGDTLASVQGYVHVRLDLQSFHGVVYVIDLPQDGDMTLGQVWLKDHKAALVYANRCVNLAKNGKRLVIRFQKQSVMTEGPDDSHAQFHTV